MPRINFRSSQTDFEPLPNDAYLLKVSALELKHSKPSTKNPTGVDMIEAQFDIEHQLDSPEHTYTRKITNNFVLAPSSGWRLKEFLEAANVPHEALPGSGKGEFDVSFNLEDALHAQCVADMVQETYTQMDQAGQPVFDPSTSKPKSGVRNTIKKF